MKDLHKGSKLHMYIQKHKCLRENAYVGSTLVNMYAKCGALAKAQQVLSELPFCHAVSWNALIAGYAQQGKGDEALNCFDDMLSEGHSPTEITFTCVLKACGSIGAADKGEQIHEKIVSIGMLEKNVVLGNSLVSMYVKCGALAKAQQVLKELPIHDVVSWSALIAGYAQEGQGVVALKCFDELLFEGHFPDIVTVACVLKACGSIGAAVKGAEIHEKIVRMGMLEKTAVLGNSLVGMYVKCGALAKAQQVLQELSFRDVVSWNALIAGYVQEGQGEEALKCFNDMVHEGHIPSVFTFACILKACGSIRAAAKGEEIHEKIVNMGMWEKDAVLKSALVDMYVKCGALSRAQQTLEQLSIRDVVSWSAVIAGYAQKGQGEKALKCFDDMLHEGHSPTAATFACVLKACGSIRASDRGEEIHEKIVSLGILEKNIVLGTSLVSMYINCGVLARAQQVFEELPIRDEVSWSALIAGYAQQGQVDEALKCFGYMLQEGQSPNAVTFICLLKACGSIKAVAKGEEIHEMVVDMGMLEKDVTLGIALIDMYVKCGALAKGRQVLEELPIHDVVSWSALIAGYALEGQGREALKCFDDMLHEGHCPNAVTFICVLKACGSIRTAHMGIEIHEKIVDLGMLENDVVLGNCLIDMYVACSGLAKAQQVFEELPIHDVVSWNTLIAGNVQQYQLKEALKLFDDMLQEGHSPTEVTFMCALKACGSIGSVAKGEEIHDKIVTLCMLEKDVLLGNSLVDMYMECGALAKAQEVFEELPIRDVISWNVLIAGYVQQGHGEEALKCFNDMLHEGHCPTVVTFICALKACGSIDAAAKGKEIHEKILTLGMLEKHAGLGNSLMDMYMECSTLTKGQQVFEELPILRLLPVSDVISWSALIARYTWQGQGEKALKCFDDMLREGHFPNAVTFMSVLKACGSIGAVAKGKEIHGIIVSLGMLEEDIVLGNALVDMYMECGAIAKAQKVFEELPIRDIVSWNALIAGYVQQGLGEEALKCFDNMQYENSPTAVTFICVLKACGSMGAAAKGEEIHAKIVSLAMLEKDIILGNSLMDMYARCGALTKAQEVLEELPVCDAVSWSAVVCGYAQQGQSVEAINCFERMQSSGVKPNLACITAVLKACNHSGLLDEAETFFIEMSIIYGIHPNLEHYCCMTDVFARAGKFNKALSVITEMPYDKCLPTWVVLLGACRKWAEVNIGTVAFKHALNLDESNIVAYILMADTYTAAGMQEEVHKVKVMTGKQDMKKLQTDAVLARNTK